MITYYACEGCEARWRSVDQLNEIRGPHQRAWVRGEDKAGDGEPPAGQCPKCGFLCYPRVAPDDPAN